MASSGETIMTISNGLMILAVLLGPVFAVQAQKLLERWQESNQRKQKVFKTLMATRGTVLSIPHVEALNMIDLEFSTKVKKEKRTVEAWKIYLDHLNGYKIDPKDKDYQIRIETWNNRSNELLTDLLYEMSQTLGYEFDKVHLKKGSCRPQGHDTLELEQGFIRRSVVDLFFGEKSLPVTLVDPLNNKSAVHQNKEEHEGDQKNNRIKDNLLS